MEAGAAEALRNGHAAISRSFGRLSALWERTGRFGRFIAHAYELMNPGKRVRRLPSSVCLNLPTRLVVILHRNHDLDRRVRKDCVYCIYLLN